MTEEFAASTSHVGTVMSDEDFQKFKVEGFEALKQARTVETAEAATSSVQGIRTDTGDDPGGKGKVTQIDDIHPLTAGDGEGKNTTANLSKRLGESIFKGGKAAEPDDDHAPTGNKGKGKAAEPDDDHPPSSDKGKGKATRIDDTHRLTDVTKARVKPPKSTTSTLAHGRINRADVG